MCSLLKAKFVPWSIITSSDEYQISVTPLYSKRDNCSLDIIKIMYQPINTYFYSYFSFYTSTYLPDFVRKVNYNSTHCQFEQYLPLMDAYHSYSTFLPYHEIYRSFTDAVYALRIAVPLKNYITVKLLKRIQYPCTTNLEPLYILSLIHI